MRKKKAGLLLGIFSFLVPYFTIHQYEMSSMTWWWRSYNSFQLCCLEAWIEKDLMILFVFVLFFLFQRSLIWRMIQSTLSNSNWAVIWKAWLNIHISSVQHLWDRSWQLFTTLEKRKTSPNYKRCLLLKKITWQLWFGITHPKSEPENHFVKKKINTWNKRGNRIISESAMELPERNQ